VVHFFTGDPSETNGTPVTTGADGLASTPWTIEAGAQRASASGRGIASPNNNGPRKGDTSEGDAFFDPFQPIQSHFDNGFTGTPVETPLGLGSVQFTATGIAFFGSSAGRGTSENDLNPGSLFSIDPTSGQATLIGSTGINGGDGEPEVSAIAFDRTTGTLYGIAGSSCTGAQLITINPSTGAATVIGTLTGAGFDGSPTPKTSGCLGGVDALTFSADGTLYAGGWSGGEPFGGKLLKVDKATAAVLAVYPTTGGIQLSGLAFDAAGTLWSSHGNNAAVAIHPVNVTTGAMGTPVQLKSVTGALQAVVISDLAFGADGKLYASLPRLNALATIDLSDGATRGVVTLIGNFGSSEVRMAGLAIRR
jgi:hypothetical protein